MKAILEGELFQPYVLKAKITPKQSITFVFSSIDIVNDLVDTLEQVCKPFLAGAIEYGSYESDEAADNVFNHAQEWITLLRDFIRDNNGTQT